MIRIVLVGIGVIWVIVTKTLFYEIMGLCLVIIPLLIKPKKRKFRKIKR